MKVSNSTYKGKPKNAHDMLVKKYSGAAKFEEETGLPAFVRGMRTRKYLAWIKVQKAKAQAEANASAKKPRKKIVKKTSKKKDEPKTPPVPPEPVATDPDPEPVLEPDLIDGLEEGDLDMVDLKY